MIDIFSNISRQRRFNTTPIGFGGWVEVFIKVNWNWLRCYKLAQFGGRLLRPATRNLFNYNDFVLPIIFLQARHIRDAWSSCLFVLPD